jgi:hypothetical protein
MPRSIEGVQIESLLLTIPISLCHPSP